MSAHLWPNSSFFTCSEFSTIKSFVLNTSSLYLKSKFLAKLVLDSSIGIFRVKVCLFSNFLFANVGSEPRVHQIVSYSKCMREWGCMGKGKKPREREKI